MHLTADRPAAARDRVAARLVMALLAGFLVRVGPHMYALRDAGETIDDGEQMVEACADGLFERYEGFKTAPGGVREPSRTWCMVYQGSPPRRTVASDLADLDGAAVELLQMSLTVAAAFSKIPEITEALRTGIRIAEPPTHIIDDEHDERK